MKKTLTFNAAAGMGIRDLTTYYWNGFEFITSVKAFIPAERIEVEYNNAIIWLNNNGFGAVAMWPESYGLTK